MATKSGSTILVSFSSRPVRIKTDSWLALLAARKMGSSSVALVLNHTIHLHGVSAGQFLQNQAWVNHELAHVWQYQQLGVIVFLWRYLREWIAAGYANISLEAEARQAEQEPFFTWDASHPSALS